MSVPTVWTLDLNHATLLSMPPQHLYNLVHVDLSYNKLSSLEGVHTKLGNIKTLNLAGNLLRNQSALPLAPPGDRPDPRMESASPAPAGGLSTAEPPEKPRVNVTF